MTTLHLWSVKQKDKHVFATNTHMSCKWNICDEEYWFSAGILAQKKMTFINIALNFLYQYLVAPPAKLYMLHTELWSWEMCKND